MTTGQWWTICHPTGADKKCAVAEPKQNAVSATSICFCPNTRSKKKIVLEFSILNKNADFIL